MSFVDVRFWIVVIVLLLVYQVIGKSRRSILVLSFSYFFYASFDFRFLFIILLSTIVDYFCGIKMRGIRERASKKFLYLSLFVNLGLLFSFKYLGHIGHRVNQFFEIQLPVYSGIFEWVLPIGISFYTFQTLSYTFDRYRGQIEACRDFIQFANYVSFFPQLLAGPIERARQLIPQLSSFESIKKENVFLALPIIVWGIFKKVFIADNIYPVVKTIFIQPQLNIYEVVLASFLVTLVVYCDFSAYSDIARGLARIIGVEIMENFKPFIFCKNISEFWTKWHLSLTTWIRDYVFFPFRRSAIGRRLGAWSLGIPFFLVGIWHGPDVEWLYWGASASLLFVLSRSLRTFSLQAPIQLALLWVMYCLLGFFHEMRFFEVSKLANVDYASAGELIGISLRLLPFVLPLLFFEQQINRSSSPHWYGGFSSRVKLLFWPVCLFGILFFRSDVTLTFVYFEF